MILKEIFHFILSNENFYFPVIIAASSYKNHLPYLCLLPFLPRWKVEHFDTHFGGGTQRGELQQILLKPYPPCTPTLCLLTKFASVHCMNNSMKLLFLV